MRGILLSLLLNASAVVALVMGFWFFAFDVHVYRGTVIIDAYNKQTRRLEAVIVSPAELLFHGVLLVAGLVLVVYLWRKGVRPVV